MNDLNWIWLPAERFPDLQEADGIASPASPGQRKFAVAEFTFDALLPAPCVSIRILVSADTTYRLALNGRDLCSGPTPVGGDWLPLPRCQRYYADELVFDSLGPQPTTRLAFLATVRLGCIRGTDSSLGHGGFALRAVARLADGSEQTFETGPHWRARHLRAWVDPKHFDGTIAPSEWTPAAPVPDRWHAVAAPIPVRTETPVDPASGGAITVAPGAVAEGVAEYPRIHAADLVVSADGPCTVELRVFEHDASHPHNFHSFQHGAPSWRVRSLAPHSVGGFQILVKNASADKPVSVRASIVAMHYPVEAEGSFTCSDPGLTKVYDVCKWTLRICRQHMHLDSPRHQEPLACTGDYYIESLMTAFVFGDMRLAALDVRRTAGMLEVNDGRLFHTSYSLIWLLMLRDVYLFTGDRALLTDCLPALDKLLTRFRTYLGSNGLIENPPDFMFVDWLVVEGHSMHHPPKGLGQTVLNAFYHGALHAAAWIAEELDDSVRAAALRAEATALKKAFNEQLFDADRRFYIDGLNTPQAECKPWLPENPATLRHHSRHANALAVLFGLRTGDAARNLLRNMLASDLPEVQPYFMHFVLEAVEACGLFPEHGLSILRKWIPLVETCDKGLQEGWFAPQADYHFDYSHAWGGTPAYQLPARMLGFRMLQPGFREIALAPRLFDLDWADIAMPTPFGMLRCRMQKGAEPVLEIPAGLHVRLLRDNVPD